MRPNVTLKGTEVRPGEFEHVDLLVAFQQGNAIIQSSARVLRRGVHASSSGIYAAFDIDDDFVCVFGVLFEILFQEN
jgi:hypothetical protein